MSADAAADRGLTSIRRSSKVRRSLQLERGEIYFHGTPSVWRRGDISNRQ